MQEEIRVMTLVRKAKLAQWRDKTKCAEERFFTTDYFDMLIAKKYPLDKPLSQWMSEDSALTDYSRETAVQRCPLYFSEHIYNTYEKNQSKLKRGDPFVKGSAFKFLSVIQVYIAPEILRRLKNETDAVWCKTKKHAILDIFLDDLYDTVECFRRCYQNQEFVYRIYYALSAGDFTIVIKSRIPELSFGISTYLRSRIAEKKWAVYKTYTLLAMEDDIEGWENNAIRLSEDVNIGKYVLRGCYSWNYWAEHPGNDNIDGIDRLNGRYDISAELTEQEFAALYHKVFGKDSSKGQAIGQENSKVSYLADLMDREYLSYINERYLMSEIEVRLKDEDTESKLEIDDTGGGQLYALNQNFVAKLREKQSSLEMEFAIIYREHKSLKHYFKLLKRQIDFCSVLNEQSDTRVYANGMEQLLEAVLDSLDVYNKMYQNNESISLGELIVTYLGKSVYSINTYMEYVRNNNLQSLQTPNYNIESDMGMEKILIGYSEYLREFVRFYVNNSVCMKEKIAFLPIVVPNISCPDINVEALFPDDKVFPYKDKQSGTSAKLLIINSPSMMELEDVPMAMAMLCHEIAHQFRYESREERNEVLLKLFSMECADMFAEKLLAKIQTEMDEVITFPSIETIIKKALTDTIEEVLKSSEYGINKDAPLDYLKTELSLNIWNFFNDFSYIFKLDKYVKLFIKQVNEWENVDICNIESIKDFYDVIKLIKDKDKDKKKNKELCKQKLKETVVKYLEEMARKGEGVPVIYEYMDVLLKMLKIEGWNNIEEWNNIGTKAQEFIIKLHKRLTVTWQERTLKYAGRIGKDLTVSDYRMWMLTGRYLGIDANLTEDTKIHEKNRNRFLDVIKQVKLEDSDFEAALTSIDTYREITSDIFMCVVMGLSPFAYLNVIVTNMWRNDLIMNSYTMDRIITVILTIGIRVKDSDRNQALKEYDEIFTEILNKIGVEIKKYIPEEYEEFNNLSIKIKEELGKSSEMSCIGTDKYRGEFKEFRKKLAEKYKYKSDLHIKIDKILLICSFFLDEAENYIDHLYRDAEYPEIYEREFLKKDYDTAYQALSEFKKIMEKDVKMAQLDSLYHEIAHYLERLNETGKVVDGNLNKHSIEFLLKMYYNYKFAQSRGDVNENRDIRS